MAQWQLCQKLDLKLREIKLDSQYPRAVFSFTFSHVILAQRIGFHNLCGCYYVRLWCMWRTAYTFDEVKAEWTQLTVILIIWCLWDYAQMKQTEVWKCSYFFKLKLFFLISWKKMVSFLYGIYRNINVISLQKCIMCKGIQHTSCKYKVS